MIPIEKIIEDFRLKTGYSPSISIIENFDSKRIEVEVGTEESSYILHKDVYQAELMEVDLSFIVNEVAMEFARKLEKLNEKD